MADWSDDGWVCKGHYVTNSRLTCFLFSIHERSAREKISTDQVAHVLNDEISRKYIQSLKRYVFDFTFTEIMTRVLFRSLLTFSQTKYPPADISQLMG
jgi:pre-mRNA-splicing factor 18